MTRRKPEACPHPGKYHLGSDKLSIIQPHPQAITCFAREQGYVVARVELAYAGLAPALLEALNAAATEKRPEYFIALKGGKFLCGECNEHRPAATKLDVSLDEVEVWEEGGHGWLAPVVCVDCHLSIPVYIDGKEDDSQE